MPKERINCTCGIPDKHFCNHSKKCILKNVLQNSLDMPLQGSTNFAIKKLS